jgi:vancomycin resistance protein VanJ
MPEPRSRRWIPVLAGAALPWTWFPLRDLGGPVEAVAALLPLLVLVALVVVLGIAAGRRRRTLLPVAASLLVFGVVAVLGPISPHRGPPPVHPVSLVTANLYWDNPTPDAAVDAVLAAGADVEVTVETTAEARATLDRVDTAHPYSATANEIQVRSRYPLKAMLDPAHVPDRRILRVTIEAPAGAFVLYAVHSLNPLSESTFASQLVRIDRLLGAATQETLPVVIAGDFNMSDRQLGYRLLASHMRDAITASGWGRPTYSDGIWAPLFLRIDHVFVPRTWCAANGRTVDLPGSDHDGLAVAIGPCP